MTATEALRKQVKKQIDKADGNSLRRVNAILEIDRQSYEWWNDKEFVKELDRRNAALESGEDKGVTLEQFKASFEKHKNKKHAK